ncbi:hypothetical protein F4859DRAFT_511194 [Xylaria cf. heliscus]|nr:hypothetical protein F4859DRAFT_511194 [Xylaria cf. heliscus]
MANIPDEADIGFRHEVINQLVNSVDCAETLKTSLQQFFGSITADAKHKDLAYHLFLTTTLYISKKVILDEEQMSVIYRTVEQLRQEWGAEGASVKHSNKRSHTRAPKYGSVYSTQSISFGVATSPPTEPENAETSGARNVADVDADVVSNEGLEGFQCSGSTTPDSFVREAEKHTLSVPNFHEAIKPKDTADLSSQYPYGYKLMSKQGWSSRSGLGPDGSGIQRPIDAYALARFFGDKESLAAREFALKATSKAPTDDNSTERSKKQMNGFHSSATPWRQYAADPHAGDEVAKRANGNNNSTDTVQRSRVTHGATPQTNGNVKTTIEGQCVLKDTWKDASKRKSTHNVQNNVSPHEDPRETVKAPSEKTSVFVPCTSTSGGW